MHGKGCTDRPAMMIVATALDKTTMPHEVCDVLGSSFLPMHVDDSADLMRGAAVRTGDSAYLSTIQLRGSSPAKAFRNATSDALGFRSHFQVPTPITRHAGFLTPVVARLDRSFP